MRRREVQPYHVSIIFPNRLKEFCTFVMAAGRKEAINAAWEDVKVCGGWPPRSRSVKHEVVPCM